MILKEKNVGGAVPYAPTEQVPGGFFDKSQVENGKFDCTYATSVEPSYNVSDDLSFKGSGNQDDLSHSIIQSFWDSLPARSASAVEHHHTFTDATVEADCKVFSENIICIKGGYRKHKFAKPPKCGGGWGFLFLLGLVSMTMWLFFILVAVKLGFYLWKLVKRKKEE